MTTRKQIVEEKLAKLYSQKELESLKRIINAKDKRNNKKTTK